ncbi:response regulator [Bradyrhizobium sp. 150]|uniref:response regulator n=1 Tax=Bradyrhizobium sp. 150 TaxID=2782625 RepID=UPI001FF7E7DB
MVSAHSGTDALDRLRQNQDISILITDINMPGMDGHELARAGQAPPPGAEDPAAVGT